MDKIKIGEIKRQSLMLMFPELELTANDRSKDSLNDLINGLLCDPSLKSYLDSMVPAINRALGKIEEAGASKAEIKEISTAELAPLAGGYYLDLEKIGARYVKEIYKGNIKIPFSYLDSGAVLIKGQGNLKILYKPKIERISTASGASEEINLPTEVLEIIPYFVKAELLLGENDKDAALAMAEFEKALGCLSFSAESGEVSAVYSLCEV